jgi:lysine-specific demethylase 3
MCRLCGREACAECYRKLSAIPPSITPATAPKDRRDPEKRLIACVPRESHSHEQFFPISRFEEPELRAAVLEMSAILDSDTKRTDTSGERTPAAAIPELRYPALPNPLANLDLLATVGSTLPHLPDTRRSSPPPEVKLSASSPPTPESLAPDQGTRPPLAPKPSSASNAIPFVKVEITPHDIDVATTSSTSEPVSSPLLPISPSTSASELSRDTQIPKSRSPALSAKPISSDDAIPYFPTLTFSDSTLTEGTFRDIWAKGYPLVVNGVLEKFHIKWTPEYFIEKYGDHSCAIVDCVTETKREVTVGWFFALFGKYSERHDSRVWKLKDWPSSTDFKSAFPELYDDFARAVPIPSYCRRDGALNIASHFPSNAVAPDLGTLSHTPVINVVANMGFTRSKDVQCVRDR